jgi:hypothetical protein
MLSNRFVLENTMQAMGNDGMGSRVIRGFCLIRGDFRASQLHKSTTNAALSSFTA